MTCEPEATEPDFETTRSSEGDGGATLPEEDLPETRPASRSPARAWTPGTRLLDEVEVGEVLGEGGMGQVYAVHHHSWGVDMALKSPRAEMLARPDSTEAFIAEGRAWVSLGMHPNIAACFFIREVEGAPRLFLERVDGGSLADAIASGALHSDDALATVLDIAIQVARGLAFAHRRGLVHQDVKPANVLLTRDGLAKVTDFGLARFAEGAGVSGGGGTPAYLSPEQAEALEQKRAGLPASERRRITAATDVWSWAVMILEAVLGGVSWASGVAAPAVLESFPDDARLHPPDALLDELRRCLADEPEERPSLNEVATVLEALYAEQCGRPYPRPRPDAARLRADSENNRGASRLAIGDAAEAAAAFEAALAADPGHVAASLNLAMLAWDRPDAAPKTEAEVRALMSQAELREPDSARVSLARAWLELRLGAAATALALCDQALDQEPASIEAKRRRAAALMALDRRGEALAQLQDLAATPRLREAELLHELGRARDPEADEAAELSRRIRCLEEAAALGSEDPHLFADLAMLQLAAGQAEAGAAALERALALGASCPYVQMRAGILLADGDPEQARGALERALTLVPGLSRAQEMLAALGAPSAPALDQKPQALPEACRDDERWLLSFSRALEPELIGHHPKGIEALAISPDGREALVGGAASGAALYDLAERCERASFDGSAVSLAALAPGRWLLGTRDLLRIDLRADGGDWLFRHPEEDTGSGRVFSALALSPDGRRAFAAYLDESEVLIFDLESGELEARRKKNVRDGFDLDGIRHLVPSADGRWLYAAGLNQAVQLHSVDGSEAYRELPGHSGPVLRLALSSSGEHLLSSGGDRRVKLWRLSDGEGREVREFPGHDGPIHGLAMLPGDRRAISAALDGSIRVWDLLRGRPLVALNWEAEISALGIAPATENEPERLILASRDGRLALAPLRRGEDAMTSPPRDPLRPVIEKPSTALELADAAQKAASLIAESQSARGLAALRLLRRAQDLPGFARDRALLQRIREAGRSLRHATIREAWRQGACEAAGPVRSVALSPDGRLLLLGLGTGEAELYDRKSRELRQRIIFSRASCSAVGFINGQEAVGLHHRWVSFFSVSSGAILRETKVSIGADEGLSHLTVSDGLLLAGGTAITGEAQIALLDGREDLVAAVTAHDSQLTGLALLGSRAVTAAENALRLWTVSKGKLESVDQYPITGTPRCVALSPDGRSVLVGFEDGALRCWDLGQGSPRWSITLAHRVLALSFLGSGFASAASGSELWAVDLRDGRPRFLGKQRGTLLSLASQADGSALVSGAAHGRAALWEIDWLYEGEEGAAEPPATQSEPPPPIPPAPRKRRRPAGPSPEIEAWIAGGIFPWGRGVIANRFVFVTGLLAGNMAVILHPDYLLLVLAVTFVLSALAALRLLFLKVRWPPLFVRSTLITGLTVWGVWKALGPEPMAWYLRHLILTLAVWLFASLRRGWGEQSALQRILDEGRKRSWSVADMVSCAEALEAHFLHIKDKGVICELYGEAAETALSLPPSKAGRKAMRRYGLTLQDFGGPDGYQEGARWLDLAREHEMLLDLDEMQEVQNAAIQDVLADIADPEERRRVREALNDPEIERLSRGFLSGLQDREPEA